MVLFMSLNFVYFALAHAKLALLIFLQVKSVVNSEWLEGSFGNDYGIFPLSHCIALKLTPTPDPFGVSILNEQKY